MGNKYNDRRQKAEINLPYPNYSTSWNWGTKKHRTSQCSMLGPLIHPIYWTRITCLQPDINSFNNYICK